MSADNNPDLDLALKLHLQMNGSSRRTRGPVHAPLKRVKREAPRPANEGRKETPSASRSGSGSGSARAARREGTFKRLVKKQPDSDSTEHNALDDDQTTIAHDSLEPQASAKAAAAGRARPDSDVGSRPKPDPALLGAEVPKLMAEHAAKLARAAALRDAALGQPRVKCFYQGHAYGLSLHPGVLASRESLAAALRAALAPDDVVVCRASELEITVLDAEGRQSTCTPLDADSSWRAAVRAAKRVYVTSAPPVRAS